MTTPPFSIPRPAKGAALRAIALAGLLAGALDITYVFVYFHPADPFRILRGIAAGLLGAGVLKDGGVAMAAIGLALHFLIAMAAAAVFYAASRRLGVLTRHPVASGLAYGVVVWLVMNLGVLPLSANPPKTFPAPTWVPVLVAHLVCVGLPIALVIRRCAPLPTPPAAA